jgi:hypothetical protein
MYRGITLVALALLACAPQGDAPAEEEPLPEYSVIEEGVAQNGIAWGSVLVRSFSRNTPAAERERVLRRIAEDRDWGEAGLYCSEDAQRADFSRSFAEAHPGALESCAIGILDRDGVFQSWDDLYGVR